MAVHGEWLQGFMALSRLGTESTGGTGTNGIPLPFIVMLGNFFECCGFYRNKLVCFFL